MYSVGVVVAAALYMGRQCYKPLLIFVTLKSMVASISGKPPALKSILDGLSERSYYSL